MKNHSDEQLIEMLVESGLNIPAGLPQEIVSRGERMVAPLGKILTDQDYNDTPSDDPTGWAPIHALHLLGEVGSPKATGAVLDWFRMEPDTDFSTETGNAVLGRLGPGACDPILDYLRDTSCKTILRSVAARGLVQIGYFNPEIRPRMASEAVDLLLHSPGDPDMEWPASCVSAFATINDQAVRDAIDHLFWKRAVFPGIIQREDVDHDRAHYEPWWSRGIDCDLMNYFSDDFQAYLDGINSPEPNTSRNGIAAAGGSGSKKASKKKKKRRKQAKRSRRRNRK